MWPLRVLALTSGAEAGESTPPTTSTVTPAPAITTIAITPPAFAAVASVAHALCRCRGFLTFRFAVLVGRAHGAAEVEAQRVGDRTPAPTGIAAGLDISGWYAGFVGNGFSELGAGRGVGAVRLGGLCGNGGDCAEHGGCCQGYRCTMKSGGHG